MPETQDVRPAEHILDRIVRGKRGEVEALRARSAELRDAVGDAPPARAFRRALRRPGEVSVVAEVKRRSPGAGPIREGLDPADLAREYARGGAAAVSVLTDGPWFAGSLEDLRAVRAAVDLPVLRKDFVVDPLQVTEARAAGADAVLLIVRILDDPLLRELRELAASLGMDALVEVHGPGELDRALAAGARVVGINNRDLATFTTSLDVTVGLAARVPADVVLVSESGIATGADVERVGAAGADAVLVGEAVLRRPEPGAAVSELAGRPSGDRRADVTR